MRDILAVTITTALFYDSSTTHATLPSSYHPVCVVQPLFDLLSLKPRPTPVEVDAAAEDVEETVDEEVAEKGEEDTGVAAEETEVLPSTTRDLTYKRNTFITALPLSIVIY